MSGVHLRKYGVEFTVNLELFKIDGIDFRVDAVYAAGDVKIMKNEGAEANTTNSFTDEGTGYSHVITATEAQAARIVLYYVDQTGTKAWLDKKVSIETYGDPAAQHAFDLDSATVDVGKISGDATAADNLELQYDTTGLVGDTFPSNQSQLSGLANVGSAVHRPAISYTLTTGTQSANTFAATEALDQLRHEHTDAAGALELYYEFNIGAGTPASCQFSGYVTGSNDDVDVYGYDWVAAAWVQIGNISGSSSTSNSVKSFDMFVNMVGSGANSGTVRVRFYKASGLSSATLATDQLFVAYSQNASSTLDAIYFNSGASNTNTVPGTDGVPGNPVSTEAAVNTLLAATSLTKVQVTLDSSITFATAHISEHWTGEHWTAVGGSQDFSGAHIDGADVSGVWTGTSAIDFRGSRIDTATINQFHMINCGFNGTLTLGEAGNYIISGGHSAIAGSTTPIIDTGAAIANVNLSMPDFHNGVELRNINNAGTDLFSISGIGQIIYAASCSGAVNQRGNWKVTNTGGVTITEDDNTSNLDLVLADTADMQPRVAAIELDTAEIGVAGAGLTDITINSASVTALLTTQMTESYAANGVAPTLAQANFAVHQMLMQFGIAGTSWTVRKLDNTTAAFVVTLDDATNPTEAKRI